MTAPAISDAPILPPGEFVTIPVLAAHPLVASLAMCDVRLFNNSLYPWAILIPRIDGARNMLSLSTPRRMDLMREIEQVERAMAVLFPHDQTNIAAIGNIAPQLHVHIVMRRESHAAWPGPVWGGPSENYAPDAQEEMVAKIYKELWAA